MLEWESPLELLGLDRLVSLWVQPICRGMGYNILQAGAPANRGCLAM